MNKIIFNLFFSIFLSAFLWLAIIPIWHTPDEQAHFAQVAYLANHNGNNPGGGIPDTTQEIITSEILLGTYRDKVGNNRFTFHPGYNISYSESLMGSYEASISALAGTGAGKELVKSEATYYPKLYYIPASWTYRLLANYDLFTRVYAIRFWSLFLFMGNIYLVYKLGRLLFPNDWLKSLSLPLLVGFQPMMIFSNTGVNSDALGNFLFTLVIYSLARIIIQNFSFTNLTLIFTSTYLAINVKNQFVIILPILLILFLFLFIGNFKGKLKWIFMISLIIISGYVFTHAYDFKINPLIVAADIIKQFNFASFFKFSREYTLSHTFREVLPWYWGVYRWLSLTYPRFIYRIINRVLLLSAIGLIIWLASISKKDNRRDRKIWAILFISLCEIVYFLAISVYDWLSWSKSTFVLGVQGRYFFPFISINSVLILVGWYSLFPRMWNLKVWSIKLLAIGTIVLNAYAFIWVISSYYDVSSLTRFIIQASQYKPMFLKGNFLIGILAVFTISLILLIYRIIRFSENER